MSLFHCRNSPISRLRVGLIQALALLPTITPVQFSDLIAPLIGLPVGHIWRGHGSAIFLELGALSRSEGNNPTGQATLMIEWSWRVEASRSVSFGSFSSSRKIDSGLSNLVGRRIESIELFGRLPEVALRLSGGRWVSSFATAEGQPEWGLLLGQRGTISVERGAVVHAVSANNSFNPMPLRGTG